MWKTSDLNFIFLKAIVRTTVVFLLPEKEELPK